LWSADHRFQNGVPTRKPNGVHLSVADYRTFCLRKFCAAKVHGTFRADPPSIAEIPKRKPPAIIGYSLLAAHRAAHFSDAFALPDVMGFGENWFAFAGLEW